MNNNTVSTPIIDKNGKQTTVHKRADGTQNNNRIKDVPAPRITAPVANTYVAPRDPALLKEVRYKGEVMTWGDVLESVNAVGIRSHVISGEYHRTYSVVHANNPSISTQVPASIAKASGLKDVTDPISKAEDDYALAHIKWEKLESAISLASYGKSTDDAYKAANEQRNVANSASVRLDTLRRDRERDILEELSEEEVGHMVYDESSANRYKVEAMTEYAIDNNLEDLTMRIANSSIRSFLDEDHREMLIDHPSERVRGAYLEGNSGISPLRVLDVIKEDSSIFVVSAARANLRQRKIDVTTDEDGEHRIISAI